MILISINTVDLFSIWAILAVGLYYSIMFLTIFTLNLVGLGDLKAQAFSPLCTAIAAGAIILFIFGTLIDSFGFKTAFILTIGCYAYNLFFGRMKTKMLR
jgi:FHS family L-fucose permease-like MFS transporter